MIKEETDMVKRVLAGILAVALLFPVVTADTFAAAAGGNRGNGCGRNFVDKDGDGICDNYAGGGRNFVDKDGDGICDNYADGKCPQNGAGRKRNGQGGNANNQSLKKNQKKISLKKGKAYRLKVNNIRQNKNQKNSKAVYYKSSNRKVATVSKNGVIKARKKGKCTVYAYYQKKVCKKVNIKVS